MSTPHDRRIRVYHHDITRTSGENIGDSGIIQAYRAWKAQYHTSLKDGTEYLLPGLSFTRWLAQCFSRPALILAYTEINYFLSLLHNCGLELSSLLQRLIFAKFLHPRSSIWRYYQVQRIRTDPHSPTRFRVDGTVTNIPEFAKAFKCPKNSKVSLRFTSALNILLPCMTTQLNPPNADRCILWS